LPKSVLELYLPEEQDACAALYRLYSALPAADLARLHAGQKLSIDGKSFDRAAATKVAAWFNSARWGREPPAERLGTGSVAQSVLLWKCGDDVVDFRLQSPQRKIWRALTIACAPERAGWVGDGLPLLPSYSMTPWPGRTHPPYPRPPVPGYVSAWKVLRFAYPVYAELPPAKLRQLHQRGELYFRFDDLSKRHQDAVTNARDAWVLAGNMGRRGAIPLDFSRSPALRARHFGITRVVFTYASSQPNCLYSAPQGIGLVPIPRPYRAVFLATDPLSDDYLGGPPRKHPERDNDGAFLVAIPAEAQRRLLVWSREMQAWRKKWELPDGQGKPGAPIPPTIRDYF
jgi:hypothetical protein